MDLLKTSSSESDASDTGLASEKKRQKSYNNFASEKKRAQKLLLQKNYTNSCVFLYKIPTYFFFQNDREKPACLYFCFQLISDLYPDVRMYMGGP